MSGTSELTGRALDQFPLPTQGNGGKDAHGSILVVAGSRTLPGAALLCARSAMRAGAGKLKIATVESIAIALGTAMPESRTIGMPEADDGGFAEGGVAQIAELAAKSDAVIAGPGMLESSSCGSLAEALLDTEAALAFDAGILRSISSLDDEMKKARQLPILLPHAGEMADLLGCEEKEVEAAPIDCGKACAERFAALTLVKGSTSHVVHPDGRVWTYNGGADGLGVSGSGDALAGIVGGLLARGAEPLAALLWAVLLHGEAGEVLSKKVGPVGFLAREIPEEIPALLAR